jgi:hypothetical protein
MMRVLTTTFQGREIVLECTHKKQFPPPQMYGSTPEDIDVLWRQGAINATQYQLLKTWQEKCGLMVMGPRCLDCPLALKLNPRPGRPQVTEPEPWLEAKKRIHWEDMKNGKHKTGTVAAVAPEPEEPDDVEPEELEAPEEAEEFEEPEEPEPEGSEDVDEMDPPTPSHAVTVETTTFLDDEEDAVAPEEPAKPEEAEAPAADDDIIDALAKDG